MAKFTVLLNNGLKFNIKAQTVWQAANKADDFLLDIPALKSPFTAYSEGCHQFDNTAPFITMTKSGYLKRYKLNIHTNRKVIAKLLALV